MTVVISEVRSRRDLTSFIRQPYRVYLGDPHWVAPLEQERRRYLSARHNPLLRQANTRLFLAWRDGQPVGRIAALADPRYEAVHATAHGFFGMFECADDVPAAHALVGAAESFLRGNGCKAVLGPMNLSANAECGLLVDGFDERPTVMMPYNPPYYADLLTSCGFGKARDLWTWRAADPLPTLERAKRITDRIRQRPGLAVRHLDRSRYAEEIGRIKQILNSTLSARWGFVPMSDAEMTHLATELKPILRPELALFVELHGEPVAFAVALPDVNQALQPLRGRLTRLGLPIGAIRLALGMRRITRGRLVALGVAEQHRNRGLEALLGLELYRRAGDLGYTEREISWTDDSNTAANLALEGFGARRVKTHRIYEKTLCGS